MNELQKRIFSQETQVASPSRADRRREPRTRCARPVYVRPADPSDTCFEEVRTMTDFSRIGFCFITPRIESYRKGMSLYVIPAFGCFNFEYLGEVVRIEELPSCEYGIAVRLLRIGSPAVNASTLTMSAFRSFGNIPDGSSQP
jgi:PilZ domain